MCIEPSTLAKQPFEATAYFERMEAARKRIILPRGQFSAEPAAVAKEDCFSRLPDGLAAWRQAILEGSVPAWPSLQRPQPSGAWPR